MNEGEYKKKKKKNIIFLLLLCANESASFSF